MLVGGGFHDTKVAPMQQEIGDGNCDMCLACSSGRKFKMSRHDVSKEDRGSPVHLELPIISITVCPAKRRASSEEDCIDIS